MRAACIPCSVAPSAFPQDLVKLLALATDDPRLENVDEERVISLVAGAASLQGVLHQLDLSTWVAQQPCRAAIPCCVLCASPALARVPAMQAHVSEMRSSAARLPCSVAVAYDRAREAAARGWADHEAEPVLDVDSDAVRGMPGQRQQGGGSRTGCCCCCCSVAAVGLLLLLLPLLPPQLPRPPSPLPSLLLVSQLLLPLPQ